LSPRTVTTGVVMISPARVATVPAESGWSRQLQIHPNAATRAARGFARAW
jgi:hypothetical protein